MKELLMGLIDRAISLGARDADAILTRSESVDANIYQGEVDEYNHAQTQGIGLRAFVNGRVGYAYSESLTEEAIEELAADAVANAAISDVDENASLYRGKHGGSGNGNYSAPLMESEILSTIRTLYDALMAEEPVSDTMRCAAEASNHAVYYADSRGTYLHQGFVSRDVVAAPIVTRDDYRETGYDFYVGTTMGDLSIPTLVERSIQRGMRYYGAGTTQSRACPVVIHHEAIGDLISTFSSIFSAQRALDGLSLLKGKEGEAVAAPCVTLTDSPISHDFGYTALFDGEGVPKVERDLINGGILTTLLHNVKTANAMGKAPTGNAARSYAGTVNIAPNNLILQPGEDDFAHLLTKAGSGVIIYEVSGLHAGANTTSGDFSLLCKGQEIVDGKAGKPFTQAVLSGNFYELLKNITAVGSDSFTNPSPSHSITAPSVLVTGLTIAG